MRLQPPSRIHDVDAKTVRPAATPANLLELDTRRQWRAWLQKHHATEREVWLVYWRKASGKPRIPYNDAVEEALCFGWIDGQQKGIDDRRLAQRFTPRRPGSGWSELTKERVRRLIADGKMMPAGMAAAPTADLARPFRIPADIRKALQADPDAWRNFQAFPDHYQRIRVAYVDHARDRGPEFDKRLQNLVTKSAAGKMFGLAADYPAEGRTGRDGAAAATNRPKRR
jgi:uncharacterized protein YdeI (YjbR/CyaY-like superfamily)